MWPKLWKKQGEEEEEQDAQDEEKGGWRRRFPGAQVARPGAEQWEMAEELHMMQRPPLQCHGSEESCKSSHTSNSPDPFHTVVHHCQHQTPLQKKKTGWPEKHWSMLLCRVLRGRDFSLCCPGRSGWQRGRNMFTWPFHLRDWQPGRWEGALELSCSVWSPQGPSVPSERSWRLSFPHN